MPGALPEPEDDHDRAILGHIARVGWSVIGIPKDAEGPGYSFSVGLFHTFGHPELVVMGFDHATAMHLLNDVGERLRSGERFAAGDRVTDLMSCPLAFVPVDPQHHREYLGYARWLHRGNDFPVLQLVWPDKAGLFPWEAGYDARFFAHQRVLGAVEGLPHGWPFPDPTNVATFTTRQVIRDGHPILRVTRDADDGAWQFHTGDAVSAADGMIVSLAEMLKHDPTLSGLGNLPPGSRATRPDVSSRWVRTKGEE